MSPAGSGLVPRPGSKLPISRLKALAKENTPASGTRSAKGTRRTLS